MTQTLAIADRTARNGSYRNTTAQAVPNGVGGDDVVGGPGAATAGEPVFRDVSGIGYTQYDSSIAHFGGAQPFRGRS